ncbi:MAG: FecR domain-containing protein [Woeseiaceae bacterium]|nr:FecR domain-containing protein [Woeseiaceae bacterium]
MTSPGNDPLKDNDDALEELLGHATPRPTPPAELMQKAKLLVEREWLGVARARTLRRRFAFFATAATVLVAVTLVTGTWMTPSVQPRQVASLSKTVGAIYLLGEKSELHDAENLQAVTQGQTIVTATGSAVSLSWGSGGSLRMDAATEVHFAAADRIELRKGRVYFDSMSKNDDSSQLTIATEHGDVRHIGTQFITDTNQSTLTVSVREGKVIVDGRYREAVVDEGLQVSLVGSRDPQFRNIRRFGQEWEWIEKTAPAPGASGQKLIGLLDWISRETGLGYTFESEELKVLAENLDAQGDIVNTPREALAHSMLVNNLHHRIDLQNGEILIRDAGH